MIHQLMPRRLRARASSSTPGTHRLGRARRAAPPRRPHPAFLRGVAFATALGICVALAPLAHTPRAEAAILGRMVWIGGWPIGTFLSSDGEYVYCIEPGTSEPKSDQQGVQTLDSLPAYSGTSSDVTGWSGSMSSGPLSGERLRQINYVLWEHGRTTDSGSAAVVQIAVWILRGDPGAKPWLDHHIAWLRAHGGGSYVDWALRLADEARAQALDAIRPEPGSLAVERDEATVAKDRSGHGGDDGHSGSVSYPRGTTELHISGGVFGNGRQRLLLDGDEAGEASWSSEPHAEGWSGSHEVSVTGKWRLSSPGWPSATRVFSPSTAGQQRLAAGMARSSTSFGGELQARDAVDTSFSPVLSTRVPARFLGVGEPFADTVTLSVADGSNPWPSRLDGGQTEFAPVLAEGVVYGPFDSPRSPSAEPPADAPVAGRARLLAEDGPGEYPVASSDAVTGSGYYSWVWSIRAEEQPVEVRDGALIDPDYRFSDLFGLSEEEQVAPMRLRWSTSLEERELSSERLVLRDRIAPEVEGGVWLRDAAGAPIPARIRLTVFQSDEEPRRRKEAPEGAVEIARGFVDLSSSGGSVEADAIALPPATRGWVTVQACLLHEDQPEELRGYAEEWCDDYGMPEETARISSPAALSVTGGEADPRLGALPLLGLALLYSGVSALLTGALLRRSRRVR